MVFLEWLPIRKGNVRTAGRGRRIRDLLAYRPRLQGLESRLPLSFTEFPAPNPGSVPLGIAVGPDGNLWFTEQRSNTIAVMAPDGTDVHHYPVPTPNSRVVAIVADPNGAGMWFTEQNSSKIGFITLDGSSITEYPTPTANSGPVFITAGPDGNLWWTEEPRNQLGSIHPDGTGMVEYPVGDGPIGITCGEDGNLWFTEGGGDAIGTLAPDGTGFAEYPVPTADSHPSGIADDGNGHIWFTEYIAGKIGYIGLDGTGAVDFATPTADSGPQSIILGPDGNMWFTETGVFTNRDVLGFADVSGAITELHTPSVRSAPVTLTLGPDGTDLWFVEAGVSKVAQYTLDGASPGAVPARARNDLGTASLGPDQDHEVLPARYASRVATADNDRPADTTATSLQSSVVFLDSVRNLPVRRPGPGFDADQLFSYVFPNFPYEVSVE